MTDDLEPLTPVEGVERFLEHREPSVRPSTLQNAETRLGHFLEWCEENEIENLNELTGRRLADFVRWRQGEIAAITLQKQLSTIRVALEYWADIEAVDEGLREKVHAPELPDGAESRDISLPSERADRILEYLGRYDYASFRHTLLSLLWRTGMRRGAARSIDLEDLHPDEYAIELVHRPETDTPLKNGERGQRMVYLGPRWYQILEDYRRGPREDVTDENGRRPLLTTTRGRPHPGTLYDTVVRATQPCILRDCPHDRVPEECEARGTDGIPSKCPSAVGPHAVRRGSITHHLNQDAKPDVVSERMDVSLDVLYEHYDARTELEKMHVRRRHLPGE